ncbi:LytTR family DNA-binding domain-containing protein [Neolewinella lacunae]|uniref:Response regulator transcription factor n=1 Tax=Neolewinella lacunae TaxID=1517758 RepID=A0A923TCL3_9BACT|nr:LytTR family DNA-binding domain-containing protein [Neolewinella lacunae]MBC6993852.1 response regulator transcription factor [Neolewinella lacunae]MDN3637087.1 LytTR family DNA-binding domain-containing protein [Neolewinella lacunae]
MIHAIIVDDEPLAQDILETYLQKIPQIELVAKCDNAFQANDVLNSQDVDLMFLDISMPQMTGTDFLRSLKDPPVTIFTTAYPNYALDGFELNALDYLVKPISTERFLQACNRAIEQAELKQKAKAGQVEDGGSDFFFVKADKKLVRVNLADIVYIEGLKDYVIIRMPDDRVITLQTMKSLEDRLPPSSFQRIHRSFIVNLDRIEALHGNMVEVKEKGKITNLPVGKSYRDELAARIDGFKL